jgi:NADPH:quinone reductase-like Zn-dependent oxidoreductase
MIPKTMKAFVTVGHGDLDKLEYQDVPVPEPSSGEVLLEVAACGLNNTDVWTREGRYGTERDPYAVTASSREPGTFPLIQGSDVVGRVVAVGSGISTSRIGERVIVNLVLYDPHGDGFAYTGGIGSNRPGGYAEYVAVPAQNAHPINSALSDAELATFPCAYLTAEHMLDGAGVKAGETVVVTGASGGVGSALVQLGHVRGALVVAITSQKKSDRVRSLRPMAVIARDVDDLAAALAAELRGIRVMVVADVVGGPQFGAFLTLLAEEGRYVTAGAIAGPLVQLDLRTVYLKRLKIVGVSLGSRRQFEKVLRYIEAGKIRPLLARTYPLAELKRAQTDFLSKEFFGNLVVIPP